MCFGWEKLCIIPQKKEKSKAAGSDAPPAPQRTEHDNQPTQEGAACAPEAGWAAGGALESFGRPEAKVESAAKKHILLHFEQQKRSYCLPPGRPRMPPTLPPRHHLHARGMERNILRKNGPNRWITRPVGPILNTGGHHGKKDTNNKNNNNVRILIYVTYGTSSTNVTEWPS